MSLQTMPIDISQLEFRYHGASEYKAYNSDTDKRETDQARDEDTGYPIFVVRCQVLFRDVRESGLISVRVPMASPPPKDLDFEHPVAFTGATAKSWRMEGRDGQTWTAKSITILDASGAQPGPSSTNNRKPSKPEPAAA